MVKSVETIKYEDYKDVLESYAWVAYKKVKKPTYLSPEDFIQDAYLFFIRVRDTYKPKKGTTFKTYLIFLLRNHFTTQIHRSYKTINSVDSTAMEDQTAFMEMHQSSGSSRPESVVRAKNLLAILPEKQREYVLAHLNPEETLVSEMSRNYSKRRSIMRKYLGLTSRVERKIRKGIKQNLQLV